MTDRHDERDRERREAREDAERRQGQLMESWRRNHPSEEESAEEGASSVSSREQAYFGVLVAASVWGLISALAADFSARLEFKTFARGWVASFVISALVAAYCFWRLLGGVA